MSDRRKGIRNSVKTIIAGGQTGVDRAALDFALDARIGTAGYIPRGREAEDGPLAVRYRGMTETESADPAVRTQLNVLESDCTLIISRGALKGGSALTEKIARRTGKPYLHIDLSKLSLAEAAADVRAWLEDLPCEKLNIGGPRESEETGIYDSTLHLMRQVFG